LHVQNAAEALHDEAEKYMSIIRKRDAHLIALYDLLATNPDFQPLRLRYRSKDVYIAPNFVVFYIANRNERPGAESKELFQSHPHFVVVQLDEKADPLPLESRIVAQTSSPSNHPNASSQASQTSPMATPLSPEASSQPSLTSAESSPLPLSRLEPSSRASATSVQSPNLTCSHPDASTQPTQPTPSAMPPALKPALERPATSARTKNVFKNGKGKRSDQPRAAKCKSVAPADARLSPFSPIKDLIQVAHLRLVKHDRLDSVQYVEAAFEACKSIAGIRKPPIGLVEAKTSVTAAVAAGVVAISGQDAKASPASVSIKSDGSKSVPSDAKRSAESEFALAVRAFLQGFPFSRDVSYICVTFGFV
jgi:hypothetical protein